MSIKHTTEIDCVRCGGTTTIVYVDDQPSKETDWRRVLAEGITHYSSNGLDATLCPDCILDLSDFISNLEVHPASVKS